MRLIKGLSWWKIATIVLLLYTIIAGFLVPMPNLGKGNLYQTMRNLFFHVPMWSGMLILYAVAR